MLRGRRSMVVFISVVNDWLQSLASCYVYLCRSVLRVNCHKNNALVSVVIRKALFPRVIGQEIPKFLSGAPGRGWEHDLCQVYLNNCFVFCFVHVLPSFVHLYGMM